MGDHDPARRVGAGRDQPLGAAMLVKAMSVNRLSVPFGTEPGLEDVTFAVNPGERFVVIGASGAGKTTLLRAIAGLIPISMGEITVGDRVVNALPPERRDVVYLHQTPLLFPHMSVRENVAFPLRVRG